VSRGRRIAALVGVALVAAALVAIVRRDPKTPTGAPSSTVTAPAPPSSAPASAPPRLPSERASGAGSAPDAGVPRTYTLPDGTRVRDHRVDPSEPFSIPSTPPQRRVPPMKSDEVARVHAQLRPLTDACTAQVPVDERAAGASVLVRLLVTVDAGRLVVDEATATGTGLGASAAAVEACIRERAASIQMASDHASVQRYPLTFPYRVRR
jgi:hypothetical protein